MARFTKVYKQNPLPGKEIEEPTKAETKNALWNEKGSPRLNLQLL